MIFMVNICKSIISVDLCRPRFNQDFDMMRFLASPSPAPERKVRMELGKIVGQVAEVYGSLSLLYGFLGTVFFWGDSTSTIFFVSLDLTCQDLFGTCGDVQLGGKWPHKW